MPPFGRDDQIHAMHVINTAIVVGLREDGFTVRAGGFA